MRGSFRFLYLYHLLYGICVKIFTMNRYISKSYTTRKNTIDPTIYRTGAAVVSTITSIIKPAYYFIAMAFANSSDIEAEFGQLCHY